jgi:glycosyltransferase involved in cell wall biosynthesis
LTVALDATYSLSRSPSGVAVYCSNLIEALAAIAPEERYLLCYRANRFLKALRTPLPGPNCSRKLLEEAFCIFFRDQVSIFHGLNQRLPKCRFRRTVTTFHDLFVINGDYSSLQFRRRFTLLAEDAARRSDRIITVSQYTADQVARHLGYPREQISVVHHGIHPLPRFSNQDLAEFRRRHDLEAPFLLHVGAIQKRKNIVRVVEAFERLNSQFRLVLAGSSGYGAEEIMARIDSSQARERIHVHGYVDDDLLARLYRTATALVFPSLEEGFGFPVVEAMSAGLPVVTSNRSSLPEVAGGAARLVDPESTDEIEAGIEEVIVDQDLRQRLISQGQTRAAEFNWIKAAHETLQVYDQLQ